MNRRTFLFVALAFVGGVLLLWTVGQLVSPRAIEIVEAEYGVPGRTCTAGAEIKKHVGEACGGLLRLRCLVSVGNGWCGDPAPGIVKTLTIDYICGTTRKRAWGVEHTGVELSCP